MEVPQEPRPGNTRECWEAEVVGGLVRGSLALLADTAHMLTDVGGRPAIRRAPRTTGRIAEITLGHLLRNSILLPPSESARESQTVNGVNALRPLLAVPVTSGPLLGCAACVSSAR